MAKGWIPDWMRSPSDTDGEGNKDDKKVEVPKEFKEAIEGTVKASLAPIEARLSGLDALTAFAEDYKKDKDAAAAEAARKAVVKNTEGDEDLAARLLSDPRAVIDEMTKGQKEFMLMTQAQNVKREVFEDNKEEYPYYSGEIKTEVDKVLSEQTLAFRNSPAAVANVYHTVVGKRVKDVNEGKIKSRFASSTGTTNGSVKTEDQDLNFEMTPEMVRVAKLNGMDPKDYMDLLKRAAKAGEIEYV